MKIPIKQRYFEGYDTWESKQYGVVLVEKEEDIEPLWKLLCEQDEYWVDYSYLIKLAPTEINNEADLYKMCNYVGKTDIYNVKDLQSKISFIIYQYDEDYRIA